MSFSEYIQSKNIGKSLYLMDGRLSVDHLQGRKYIPSPSLLINLILISKSRKSFLSNHSINFLSKFILRRRDYYCIYSIPCLYSTWACWFLARNRLAHLSVVVVVSCPAAKKSAQVAMRLSWLEREDYGRRKILIHLTRDNHSFPSSACMHGRNWLVLPQHRNFPMLSSHSSRYIHCSQENKLIFFLRVDYSHLSHILSMDFNCIISQNGNMFDWGKSNGNGK